MIKKYNIDIILLVIIAGVLLLGNIMIAIPRELSDMNRHPPLNLSDSKVYLHWVQSALSMYYADNDGYPNEKDFRKAVRKIVGQSRGNGFNDTMKMIRKYKRVNINKKTKSYIIYFRDNSYTYFIKENNFILTPGTDTNKLFK